MSGLPIGAGLPNLKFVPLALHVCVVPSFLVRVHEHISLMSLIILELMHVRNHGVFGRERLRLQCAFAATHSTP